VATERLRLRISHDLHDQIGAGLSSIALLSDSVNGPALPGAARSQVQRIGESARTMVGDLRDIVWAMDPGSDRLDDLVSRMRDLIPTLLPGMKVDFHAPQGAQLVRPIAMTARRDLYLMFKEILNNIARHARATEVRIELGLSAGLLTLMVADNGIGFDPGRTSPGTGWKSLRARAERLGASFEMVSEAAGGTSVKVSLPQTRMRPSGPLRSA
jgi:signal transduction histidine kinase